MPYWPLFAGLCLTAILGAWLYLRFATPYYESTARIMIKDERKGAEDAKAIEQLNTLSSKKIIENEMEVISSRTLLQDVVSTLGLYAPVFMKGKLRDASAYTTSPVKIEVRNPDLIKVKDKIAISYDAASHSVRVADKTYPTNQWVSTPYGDVRFSANAKQTSDASGNLYFSLIAPKAVASDIQSRLKVSPSNKQSSILSLSLRDQVPERGEDILNELLSAYNKATIHDKNALAVNTLAFVDDRLKNVEADLNAIEKKTEQYKSGRGAIDIGEQGRLFLQNVSSNDQKLGDINMQMAVLGQVERYVQSKNGASGIVPSTLGVSDPMLSQLVSKLYTLELEYESLSKTTAENNPAMLSLAEQINRVKPGILENIESQRRGLEASRSNLTSTNNSYAAMLQSIPEKERALIDINREQTIKNGIYGFLLQKREETALSHASTVPDSRIIDRAESSTSPVSPKGKVIYLFALVGALVAGIGIVSGRETFSRKIMFRQEIESLTAQPIIGEIAAETSRDQIVIGTSKKTFIAEQFRKLRTTLKYVGINSKKKRILVTSAITGEGKSFVASNLALSLALTGKKVVLVDADLNNPSLHKKLSMRNNQGVTEYLMQEAEPEEIIQQSVLNKNLYFVSAGTLPQDPSELMMNGRMETFLDHLDGMFDFIVVDTAPVSPVTDAYIISPLCDTTLYVVRHHYTPKVFVERIDENNKINHLNNLAIVFNGVRSRGFGSKNYGYGYGYGYIYKDNEQESRKRISQS